MVRHLRQSLEVSGAVTEKGMETLLHQMALFKPMSYDFVETVLSKVRRMLKGAGEILVAEETEAPSIYILVMGKIDLYRGSVLCRTLHEGESIGEVQLVSKCPWYFTAVVQSTSLVCEVSRQIIEDTMLLYPEESPNFNLLCDYAQQRVEERRRNEDRWKLLRQSVCLRGCSEACLKELEAVMEQLIRFPSEVAMAPLAKPVREQSKGPMAHQRAEKPHEHERVVAGSTAHPPHEQHHQQKHHAGPTREPEILFLVDGYVVVEVADRVVRRVDVSHPKTSVVPAPEVAGSRRQSVHRMRGLDNHTSALDRRMSQKSPAEQRSLPLQAQESPQESQPVGAAQGPQGDQPSLAAVFGEEQFLSLKQNSTISVRARRMCDFRILTKSLLLKVLERFPDDQRLVHAFFEISGDKVFPPLPVSHFQQLHRHHCSQEFLSFLQAHTEDRILAPGDRILPDSNFLNISGPIPPGDPTLCRLNAGHAQPFLQRPNAERVPDGHAVSAGVILTGEELWQKRYEALEVCFVTTLHRGVIAKALEDFPLDRAGLLPALAASQQLKLHSSKQDKVTKVLREKSVFGNTSPEFLSKMVSFGTFRVSMPGDRIIEEGEDGHSLFIIWSGICSVVKEEVNAQRKTRTLRYLSPLSHGSIVGELSMLGVQAKRSASIIAGTVAVTWEVGHSLILNVLEAFPEERQTFLRLVEEHLNKLAAPRIIYHQFFTSLSQQFRTLIGVNCERKLFFPGENIVREGAFGDRMYMINVGTARVEMQHHNVMQIKGGSHIGFPMVCTTTEKDRYPYTVTSETMTQVLVITRASFQHALQKYPEMTQAVKTLEEEERTRVRKQREGFLKVVQKRRGLVGIIQVLRHSAAVNIAEVSFAFRSLMHQVIKVWRSLTVRTAALRKEEAALREVNVQRIQNWLSKRREQIEHIKPRLELKLALQHNLYERGPMILCKQLPPSVAMTERRPHHVNPEDAQSPYLAPKPTWQQRGPLSLRPSRRLPPIQAPPWAPTSPCTDRDTQDPQTPSKSVADAEAAGRGPTI